MDNRGYGSGYSSWGGGNSGNRGSGGFDMYGGGYKDSGLGGYGGGGSGGGGHMKRGSSGGSLSSSGADAVIAKINQRLDMLTQLEGGFRGPRGDRFDEYESFDSRSSGHSSSRDLYRSGSGSYGFGDDRGDNMLMNQRGGSGFGGGIGLGGGGGFDSPSSSFGVAKMRQNMRDSFASGQGGGSGGWVGAGRRSPRRGGSAGARGPGGGFGGRRSDPTQLGGGMRGSGGGGQSHRGHSPGGGRGKLPSLLSNRMYPESGGFQGSAPGPQDFPGRHFGGGPRGGRQRGRKRPLIKQQVKPQRDGQKKRKQTPTGTDEPESKMNKTEGEETEGKQEEPKPEGEENNPETATEEAAPSEEGNTATPTQEKKKPALKPTQGQEKQQKARKRRGFMDRLMFACSVCKFRSFYKEEMDAHLESRFHKDHFKFLSNQLSKPTTDFLQEYMQNKFKKTAERVSQLENQSATICQIYREQDLTRELGMEHFMKKVEAAHCGACDIFIPMQPHLIQKHIKSPDHNYNRKGMMEQSKRSSLSVARSILNHKLIGKKLESYLKGENPFTGNQDEHDPEDSAAMDVSELEMMGETTENQQENPQAKDESMAEGENVGEAAETENVEGEAAQEENVEGENAEAAQEEEPSAVAFAEEGGEENMEQQEIQEGGGQENHGEEGFIIGEEEEGYIVHDEGEEGFHDEQEAAEECQE
ncbi:A-kinase anchor protein 8-like [Cyprinodon tularosa]|uniref:A-kinase anchor protein 8-like n=1 Tax=Cyprinodon tularosa TaxID=77115 RepID=UPI0018E2376A|nr:A-kinase anchor protein 8-like [Cyprinodon tularosa]